MPVIAFFYLQLRTVAGFRAYGVTKKVLHSRPFPVSIRKVNRNLIFTEVGLLTAVGLLICGNVSNISLALLAIS